MESTEIMAMEEYTDLLPEEPRNIEVITGEILLFKAQAGASILEIGKRLIEVKAQLGHGEWLDYLKEKVEFSPRTAQDMMRLAKEYSNTQTFAFLGAQKALQLLALSAPEREEFVAKMILKTCLSGSSKRLSKPRKMPSARGTKPLRKPRQFVRT